MMDLTLAASFILQLKICFPSREKKIIKFEELKFPIQGFVTGKEIPAHRKHELVLRTCGGCCGYKANKQNKQKFVCYTKFSRCSKVTIESFNTWRISEFKRRSWFLYPIPLVPCVPVTAQGAHGIMFIIKNFHLIWPKAIKSSFCPSQILSSFFSSKTFLLGYNPHLKMWLNWYYLP